MNNKLTFPRHDLTGKIFGRLKVISFSHYHEYKQGFRRPIWNCLCSCGNEKQLQAGQLKHGQISCGCALTDYRNWAKENFKPINMKDIGVGAFNLLYCNYKARAKKKGIKFNLTVEEFKILVSTNCVYCGRSPNQSVLGNRKRRHNGDFIYNGVDRVDNEDGYTTENSISCCGICNKAKRDLPLDEFVSWVRDITNYGSKINFNYKITNKK